MRFLISTPESLHHQLMEISRTRGQTLSGMIRDILWDWVKKERENERMA